MPSLVVWERLFVAGDDLRLTTTLLILLRLLQSSLLITIIYHLSAYEHDPDVFIDAGCVEYSENYWIWYRCSLAVCYTVLAYSVVGMGIECGIWKISGVGTPTEMDRRAALVPLCKCVVVPMFFVRLVGFIFGVYIIDYTKGYCGCVRNARSDDFDLQREKRSFCPYDKGWFHLVKFLVITMGVDLILHTMVACYISKQKVARWYDARKPPKRRSEKERSWEMTCKRCCECSSIMTCYIFGGRNLTNGGYVDVAIALTDFLDDGGSLDIVPSDIAAALICLVNIQKQKQIERKNELLKDSTGLFAKDKLFSTTILKYFRESNESSKQLSEPPDALVNSICGNANGYGDIEDQLEGTSSYDMGDFANSTTEEIEQLRHFMTKSETLQNISFGLVHDNRKIDFLPRISKILSPKNKFDILVLAEGARYSRVALAAYSWMLYVWTNRCTGCCKLTSDTICSAATCKLGLCSKNENIIGDNCCGWKHSAVLRSLGIDESEILYANFKNGIGVNPYMIILDRAWKTIVVAIRGTLSLEDMITDVTISPQSLEEVGSKCGFDGVGEYCHNGILAGAQRIYDDLERIKILDDAISNEFSGFKLRIIGHSLGAGIAAMLGLMLRKKYPTLVVLCFSPPGCVFSHKTATRSKDYVCSYILHNDVVPRLSYEAMVNLRDDVIEMIARIKVPKTRVFRTHFMPSSEKEVYDIAEKHLYEECNIPDSKFWSEFNNYKTRQQQRMVEGSTSSVTQVRNMTLPGRIVQMVRTSDKLTNDPCCCCVSCIKCTACCGMSIDTKKYKVRWSDKDHFSEIYISPSMMVDHFPYNVARALECAAKSYDIPLDQGRDAVLENSDTWKSLADKQS